MTSEDLVDSIVADDTGPLRAHFGRFHQMIARMAATVPSQGDYIVQRCRAPSPVAASHL